MSTSIDRIASGTMWMAKLLVEEPYALMRARTDLWEPWVGNDPGPPGPSALGVTDTQTVKGRYRTLSLVDDMHDACDLTRRGMAKHLKRSGRC
jgi:hypothetical protein